MQTRKAYLLLCLLLVAGLTMSYSVFAQDAEATEETPPHYDYEGETGPENWGNLADEFALCGTGQAQSPIDITGETELNLSDIAFDYSETALNIFNNGHTIQVMIDAGSSITYNGIRYELLQFHFHNPSEHTVNGEAAEMELHLVHRDPNSGNLAVVGVMMTVGDASNESVSHIFENLPPEAGEPLAQGSIDLNALLPESHHFTTYNGSLTTPPCSEIVRWLVLDSPLTITAEQLEAFAAIHEMNARPVQPLNGRDLLGDNQ